MQGSSMHKYQRLDQHDQLDAGINTDEVTDMFTGGGGGGDE